MGQTKGHENTKHTVIYLRSVLIGCLVIRFEHGHVINIKYATLYDLACYFLLAFLKEFPSHTRCPLKTCDITKFLFNSLLLILTSRRQRVMGDPNLYFQLGGATKSQDSLAVIVLGALSISSFKSDLIYF
jgi:hypothetical protein